MNLRDFKPLLGSAALAQNREVATTGNSVFDGFPSLLIMRTETEEDRETKIQIQIARKGRVCMETRTVKLPKASPNMERRVMP